MKFFALFLVLIVSAASAQIKNYKLGDLESATAAPGAAVAINPKNNKNMAVYAAGKLLHSSDAGVTWNVSALNLSSLAGTPALISDAKGNLHLVYAVETPQSQIIARSSPDNGLTWSEPAILSTAPTMYNYNPSIAAHYKKESLMVTWTQASQYASQTDTCQSKIMMSTSGGKKWSKPVVINSVSGDCRDDDKTARGSNPSVAFDNKLFVIWAQDAALNYDRSYDGDMWLSTDLDIIEQVGGWSATVPGFGPVASTPSLVIDASPTRLLGTIFLAFADTKSGNDDSDIWLMRSTNRGDNWTVPARINQDEPGKDQFLPQLAIDNANGYVYIVYYDRRNYSDNQTDVYLAYSFDGGNQFKEIKVSEKPFTPAISPKRNTTDYISLSAQKGLIVPVWTVINGEKQEVWTAVIKQEDIK